MTVHTDLERAIAMASAAKGNYLLFATESQDQKAVQVFNLMAEDMDRHVTILESRRNYLAQHNPLNGGNQASGRNNQGDGGGNQGNGGGNQANGGGIQNGGGQQASGRNNQENGNQGGGNGNQGNGNGNRNQQEQKQGGGQGGGQ